MVLGLKNRTLTELHGIYAVGFSGVHVGYACLDETRQLKKAASLPRVFRFLATVRMTGTM